MADAPWTPTSTLLPWPHERHTVADPTSPTGVRVAIDTTATPANAAGVHLDVREQNTADGFSPASRILVHVPAVDLARSGVADSTTIGTSMDPDAPIRLTDVDTGERWPYWAELNSYDPERHHLVMIHPARALREGHTYRVEIDPLVTSSGEPVPMDLPLVWSFPVASTGCLSGRLRAMVADAAAPLPTFEVTAVDDSGDPVSVQGTFAVPNYLDNDGSPGGRLLLDAEGRPRVNLDHPEWQAPFTFLFAADAAPRATMVFGHGLLSSRDEVYTLDGICSLGNLNVCGTDWVGMCAEDVPNVAAVLGDLSAFGSVPDRMLQGQLAFLLLARLANRPDGFASHPAFAGPDGTSRLLPDGAVFVGNSQGGILGGAAGAVADEWQRMVLGVPGLAYNLMLPRSVNWLAFEETFHAAYPDPVERMIALELIQMLWDRGENSGYVQHLTADPYPGVTPKTVLLIEAFGDHQVPNVSTEVLARTIGAAVRKPALTPGRSLDVEPMWGIDELEEFPTTGSVLSVWDFGTPPPPTVNLPPTPPAHGADPHDAGSSEPGVLLQAITFLHTGEVVDTCGGGPCRGAGAGMAQPTDEMT
jgi:hypothetical protein